MKRLLCTLLTTLFLSSNLFAATSHLIVASVPWREINILEKTYAPLLTLLSRELSVPVTLHVTDNYQELGERLNSGAADIGIFGGNSYVVSKERFPAIQYLATCKQPDDRYFSLIIVHRESSITSLDALNAKSFGFTDKDSTSGYIYPMLIFRQHGIDPHTTFQRTFFLKKHDKVYEAVARRTIEGGGASSTAYPEAVRRNGDVFRIIARSEPIPRNAVVAGAHLHNDVVARIRRILATAETSTAFTASQSQLKGFSINDDSFYDIIRKARKMEE